MYKDHIVKVITPAYNEAHAIAKVIADAPDWIDQYIVVDNGSTDDTAMIAQRAGATDIRVVTGYRAPEVEAFLTDLARRRNVALQPLRNPRWQDGNGRSVLSAREAFDAPFLLLMADHVLDDAILQTLAVAPLDGDDLILAVDTRIVDNPNVDPTEVTCVRREGTHIREIGKGLSQFDAYDTGAFLCTPRLFAALEESLQAGDATLSGGVRRLADRGLYGWRAFVATRQGLN